MSVEVDLEVKRQKLQQLTSHGFFMSLEERLACQHPHLTRGQRGGREEGGGGGRRRRSPVQQLPSLTCAPAPCGDTRRPTDAVPYTHTHTL